MSKKIIAKITLVVLATLLGSTWFMGFVSQKKDLTNKSRAELRDYERSFEEDRKEFFEKWKKVNIEKKRTVNSGTFVKKWRRFHHAAVELMRTTQYSKNVVDRMQSQIESLNLGTFLAPKKEIKKWNEKISKIREIDTGFRNIKDELKKQQENFEDIFIDPDTNPKTGKPTSEEYIKSVEFVKNIVENEYLSLRKKPKLLRITKVYFENARDLIPIYKKVLKRHNKRSKSIVLPFIALFIGIAAAVQLL
jgi:hypothetical protein